MQETANDGVAAGEMQMDFGDGFAYKGAGAQWGKSGKGEKNGQESQEVVEEVEEASANQAAV